MGDKTKIGWTDATLNVSRGCSLVSSGCTNCYAMRQAARFNGPGEAYEGLTRRSGGRAVWSGRVTLVPAALEQALRWRRPRRIFVNSMSDLFHPEIPFSYTAAVFAVMALARRHQFQVLTKRPDHAADFFRWLDREAACLDTTRDRILHVHLARTIPTFKGIVPAIWPLPNVWLGVSAEDQAAAEARVPQLLALPAAVRFVSAEPLIGPLDLSAIDLHSGADLNALTGEVGRPVPDVPTTPGLDWVIAGGESGSGERVRPCRIEWLQLLRNTCEAYGVAYFCKQLGSTLAADNGCSGKGEDPTEWPASWALNVRQYPC